MGESLSFDPLAAALMNGAGGEGDATSGGPGPPLVGVLIVRLDSERLAFPLGWVIEVLPAMASKRLLRAPEVIEGVINLHGAVVPLLDLRARLGLAARAPLPDDHVVICTVGGRRIGIRVDSAESVVQVRGQDMTVVTQVAAAEHLAGVALVGDGLVLVYDARSFLAADEALCLDAAMAAADVDGLRAR